MFNEINYCPNKLRVLRFLRNQAINRLEIFLFFNKIAYKFWEIKDIVFVL